MNELRDSATSVPDRCVTVDAGLHVAASCFRQHRVDEIFVARNASALRDSFVAWFDLDGILEIAECEGERVEESVIGLGHPFADRVVRQVTVVADGDVVMTAFLPGIHVVLHHMAVHARLRVVAQVAGAFAVAECEGANAGEQAEENGEDDRAFAETRLSPRGYVLRRSRSGFR